MSSPESVVIALGSNRGDRRRNLLRAIEELRRVITVVRVSSIHDTEPVDAPQGSPRFLNMVIAGHTTLTPEQLLSHLLDIEHRLGRVRGARNAPRTIDLDLIFHGGNIRRTRELTLPHPRYRDREFVMKPLRELQLGWKDPLTGRALS
jgi:2-amino-4-hydroxy-6-hydroxymethyldihydropteridine diphosphokinase